MIVQNNKYIKSYLNLSNTYIYNTCTRHLFVFRKKNHFYN